MVLKNEKMKKFSFSYYNSLIIGIVIIELHVNVINDLIFTIILHHKYKVCLYLHSSTDMKCIICYVYNLFQMLKIVKSGSQEEAHYYSHELSMHQCNFYEIA